MTGYDDRSRRMKRLIYISFIVTAVIFGLLMFQKYRVRHGVPTTPPSPPAAATQVISLYFGSPDGNALLPEAREIDACNDPSFCIQEIIREIAKGPLGDLAATIPDNTTVHSVTIDGDTAIINFGKDFPAGLPGGSSSEMVAVYSIVNSIAQNIPHVKRVRFLIDGQSPVTLKEHFDLRKPVEPNLTLGKK